MADETERALVFVYNADSGLFNTVADIGHKLFSPQTYQCDLCRITYGLFSVREEWQAFVQGLPLAAEFLHRDQFREQYGEPPVGLPAVFVREGAALTPCLEPEALAACADVAALETAIREHCLAG
ncbi:hypothetical protein SAMN05660831_02036 [Thiohalospira halophila DSM 15071]|uniref:GTPase n=1 Tax=Thiohalospira halophila DSM 15071 TaxID=1123397 RepID=A0A1I1UB53_9GAMM|nr:hypothetical protein [Thiohalospira halophila]SFD66003.1 hypothetical protein SAMN05660831_02036 [Thiohalospira halophila DSM 15071]